MNHDFQILMEFLHQVGVEVVGRESAQPQEEVTLLLERFARGECSNQERTEVCEMLRMHPAWLRWLADRVRMARESSPKQEAVVSAGRPASAATMEQSSNTQHTTLN